MSRLSRLLLAMGVCLSGWALLPFTSLPHQGFSWALYADAYGGTKFYTLTPCRVLDTRNPNGPLGGPSLQPLATRTFTIPAASCSVPTGARTITANITVTGPTQPGYLTLYASNGTQPLTSSINFMPGQTRANNVVLVLSSDGTGSIKVFAASLGTVDFILDVNGYFQ
jgi:hypothetical protein